MWYSHDMKRYGACSLREGGPCVGRPTPLPFGPTEAEGTVLEQTQVVDFRLFSRFFLHVLMLGERDRPGRSGVRLAPRFAGKGKTEDVFGETPNTAVERSEQHKSGPLCGLTALPTTQISKYSRLFAFIRGSKLPFLKVQNRLMQVVDFHDSFG